MISIIRMNWVRAILLLNTLSIVLFGTLMPTTLTAATLDAAPTWGKVLIAGGYGDSGFLSSSELYNPLTNSFLPASDTPVMNTARADAVATRLASGKVLIAGGVGIGGAILSSTELYDPATNSFAPALNTPAMNIARVNMTATLLPSGKVLIVGGVNNSGALSSTELYNPRTNSFAPPSHTPTMNDAREFATATLLPSGEVLIAGGYGAIFNVLSSTELYDPTTNSFAPPADTPVMNSARGYATATRLLSGEVLIAGGTQGGTNYLSSTELYSPATNSFAAPTDTPVMNTARLLATATLLTSGTVLIAGGCCDTGGNTLSSTELYDPASNSFASAIDTATMNSARYYTNATRLPSGEVLIAGGQTVNNGSPRGYLSSTELYDPASNSFAGAAATAAMNVARDSAVAQMLQRPHRR
jgi:hypothetical protein